MQIPEKKIIGSCQASFNQGFVDQVIGYNFKYMPEKIGKTIGTDVKGKGKMNTYLIDESL